MSTYLTRFDHFTVELSDDENQLIVTSEREADFEATFTLPQDLDVDDDEALFEYVYTPAKQAYAEHA